MSIPALPKLTDVDKFLAALAGLLAQVIELGVLSGTALHYAQVASGALAAALVFLAQPPAPKPAPTA